MLRILAILTLIISALNVPVKPPEIWATPIPDFQERHFSNYFLPAEKWGKGHRGIDLQLQEGESLYSPFDGEIHFVGKVVNRTLITLRSNSGLLASFEPVCSDYHKGQSIKKSEPFGVYCQGDSSYESHCDSCVHFSVRSEFGYLNPLLFVSSIKPSVVIS